MEKMSSKTTKIGGHEVCPGYHDENGIWNNGFYCPRWGGPSEQYCCGDAMHRFCCPKLKTTEAPQAVQYIPIFIGVAVAVVVMVTVILVSCFFCRCCLGYKKRQKRLQKAEQQQQQQQQMHDLPDIAVQASGHPMPDDHPHHQSPPHSPHGSPTYSYHGPSCSGAASPGCDSLHCGCQWSPTLPRSPMADLDNIMKQLYGDTNTSWSELEPLPEYSTDSVEKPPPYTEHDLHKLDLAKAHSKTLGRRFKEKKDRDAADTTNTNVKVTRAISDPSQLCMQTFRPIMMRVHGADLDATKRDSGVLIEEIEGNEGTGSEADQPPLVLQGFQHKPSLLHRPGYGLYERPRSRGDLDRIMERSDLVPHSHSPEDVTLDLGS